MSVSEILQKKLGPRLKLNEPLAPYVTFKIGGPAQYFYIPQNNQELVQALKLADELKLKTFILGGGSNLLISDSGFTGFVIKPENRNFKIQAEQVYAESGVLVVDLLAASLAADLTGWAWAAGLPGTVGGAIRGNAGAYGQGMSDIVDWVEIYYQNKVQKYSNRQMQFSYRHSIVKEIPAVILATQLSLKKGDIKKETEQVEAYNDRRQKTQPLELPNSGCIFKNIDFKEVTVDHERVRRGLDASQAEYQEATKYNKLPVSFILDRLNLKGKKIGGAKAEHVVMLISDIKSQVRNKLGIQLEEEVQYVGF